MLKLIFSVMLLILFSSNWSLVQNSLIILTFVFLMKSYHNFLMFDLGMNLGMDYISYVMILLSIWITVLTVYTSQKIHEKKNFSTQFITTNLSLLMALILTFSSLDYLMFYISFESSLIPTLILIIGWGYQPERIQAGIYMLFYTLFASLPLLISLLSLYKMGGTLTMSLAYKPMDLNYTSTLWYFSSVFAFMVKLPMYLFHLWLPKAHVEAPVAGSMILAGVLLKLGGYGLIRILPLFHKINKNMTWLWVSMGLIGGTIVSLMCLRQVDMKSLIAYSSVAHMGLVLSGLMLANTWGLTGSMVIMVGHGLCSSGLFCMANMVYNRTSSRSLLISKGLMSFMPSMGFWWFLLSIGNMAAPPSLNLLGEINLISSVMSWNKTTILGLSLLSFFSASYTLYLYSTSQHGTFFNSLFSCCSGKVQEFLILFLHWLPLNILILKSNIFLPY
uniref:NADH-ubiquinone oxidoreductase chain 4 n=1 Tax=Paraglypturus tonganus (nomen nudum) TaxID=1519029 RepID=A0A0U1V1H2_9EUCA|nr:NADH dehydrogenase subunit 4 [Paraglypturus tonganus (nomen nudum)]AIG22696.1 NADH dehydrogenase subunit 4 [Paraglypturus tonganus (nomen nudum)]